MPTLLRASFPIEAKPVIYDGTEISPFFSRERIARRVSELANEIDAAAKGRELVAIGVLQGACVFFADLVREIKTPLKCEFLSLTGYPGAAANSGEVKLLLDIEEPLEGCDLLLIEDLVSTGATLEYLRRTLTARRPKSLQTCTLLRRKRAQAKLDYVGFEIGDEFVVGYGIDHRGKFRELPEIGMLPKGSSV